VYLINIRWSNSCQKNSKLDAFKCLIVEQEPRISESSKGKISFKVHNKGRIILKWPRYQNRNQASAHLIKHFWYTISQGKLMIDIYVILTSIPKLPRQNLTPATRGCTQVYYFFNTWYIKNSIHFLHVKNIQVETIITVTFLNHFLLPSIPVKLQYKGISHRVCFSWEWRTKLVHIIQKCCQSLILKHIVYRSVVTSHEINIVFSNVKYFVPQL
jgi:hypothetical protein